MKIYEPNLDRVYTLSDLKNEYYLPLRAEDPEHFADSFRAELYRLLRDTVHRKNDCKLVNLTHSEALRIMSHIEPDFERSQSK